MSQLRRAQHHLPSYLEGRLSGCAAPQDAHIDDTLRREPNSIAVLAKLRVKRLKFAARDGERNAFLLVPAYHSPETFFHRPAIAQALDRHNIHGELAGIALPRLERGNADVQGRPNVSQVAADSEEPSPAWLLIVTHPMARPGAWPRPGTCSLSWN